MQVLLSFYLSSYLLHFSLSCTHIYLPQQQEYTFLFFCCVSNFMYNMQSSLLVKNHFWEAAVAQLRQAFMQKPTYFLYSSNFNFPYSFFFSPSLWLPFTRVGTSTTKLRCRPRALHVYFIEQKKQIHAYIFIDTLHGVPSTLYNNLIRSVGR